MASLREQKNEKIKATLLETRQRRTTQVPVSFDFKVRNEKRNKKAGVLEHLKNVFLEGKWVWNSIKAQTDKKLNEKPRKLSTFTHKEFDTVVHRDKDGNDVTSNVTHLTTSLRDAIIKQYKTATRVLKKRK